MYGIKFDITTKPPDKKWYGSLSDREKIIYNAYWFLKNGRDTYFYSQGPGQNAAWPRTVPDELRIRTDGAAMDCSSFAQGMYKIAGINIPGTTAALGTSSLFETINWKKARPGDIVVTATKGHIRLIVGVDTRNELLETIEVGRASKLDLTAKQKGVNFPALYYTSAKVLRPTSNFIGLSRTSYAPGEKYDGRGRDGADDTRNYIVRRLKTIKDWEVLDFMNDQQKFNDMMGSWLESRAAMPENEWAKKALEAAAATKSVVDGTTPIMSKENPQGFITRQEYAETLRRLGLIK